MGQASMSSEVGSSLTRAWPMVGQKGGATDHIHQKSAWFCHGDVIPEGIELKEKIRAQIRRNTSPHHVPKKIIQVTDIPRTISGKISELAVREVIHGRPVKNTEALANPQSLRLYERLPQLRD